MNDSIRLTGAGENTSLGTSSTVVVHSSNVGWRHGWVVGSWRETSFLAGKFEASRNNFATGAGELISFFGSSVYFLPFPLQKFKTSRVFG